MFLKNRTPKVWEWEWERSISAQGVYFEEILIKFNSSTFSKVESFSSHLKQIMYNK